LDTGAEFLPVAELGAPPERVAVAGAVRRGSWVSGAFMVLEEDPGPEPPRWHHCGLSAAKMEKLCLTERAVAPSVCGPFLCCPGGSGVFQRDLL